MRFTNPSPMVWAGIAMGVAGVSAAVWGALVSRGAAPADPDAPPAVGGGAPAPRPKVASYAMGPLTLRASAAQLAGGGAAASTASDEEVMRQHGFGYTSWFTREVENEVISRLQGWKIENKVNGCAFDTYWDPVEQRQDTLRFREASASTTAVLNDLYPTGKPWTDDPKNPQGPIYGYDPARNRAFGIDYRPERDAPALWRTWLWLRVYFLARRHVCDFIPVT